MIFKPAQPNEIFAERRWLSEPAGRWELGLQPMMFGVRVQLALVGACGPTLNYCAGADRGQIIMLLITVTLALEPFAEDATEDEIRHAFPDYTVKPIFFDPVCWPRLQEMAKTKFDIGAKSA